MGRRSLEPNAVLLGKYRIESVLGRGGMGVVLRARHLSLDEVVAIKVLGEDIGVSPETFERFQREAKAAARLKSMHAVRVTDVGRLDDGLPYMVMELLEGTDLRELRRPTGIEPRLVATAIIQTCEVLAEAHALGIVHRDLKPANLFLAKSLDDAPFIKVLDFGIAKVTDPSGIPITKTQSMLGTPAYMSPEQLRSSRTVDHRTDLWALGVVMYELLEGRRPFDHEALSELIMQIALRPATPPRRMAPPLAAIVMRCLDKEPDNRFASALDLATALVPFALDPVRSQRDVERIQALLRTTTNRSDHSTPVALPERGRLGATADAAPLVHEAATRDEGPGNPLGYAPTVSPPPADPTMAARPVALSAAEHPDRFSAAVTAAMPDAGGHAVTQQGQWAAHVAPAFTPLPSPAAVTPAPAVAAAAVPSPARGHRIAIVFAAAILVGGGAAVALTQLKSRPIARAAAPDAVPSDPPAATTVVAQPAAPPDAMPADSSSAIAETSTDAAVPIAEVDAKPTPKTPTGKRVKKPPATDTKSGGSGETRGSAEEPCNSMTSRFGC